MTQVSDERLAELLERALGAVEAFDAIPITERRSPESVYTDELLTLRELLQSRLLLREAKPYLQHKPRCACISPNEPFDTSALPCDCGLDSLLERIRAVQGPA
jgi:hypothetical protein